MIINNSLPDNVCGIISFSRLTLRSCSSNSTTSSSSLTTTSKSWICSPLYQFQSAHTGKLLSTFSFLPGNALIVHCQYTLPHRSQACSHNPLCMFPLPWSVQWSRWKSDPPSHPPGSGIFLPHGQPAAYCARSARFSPQGHHFSFSSDIRFPVPSSTEIKMFSKRTLKAFLIHLMFRASSPCFSSFNFSCFSL